MDFRRREGIPSGPKDVWSGRVQMSLITMFVDQSRSSLHSEGKSIRGKLAGASLLKKVEKASLRRFALCKSEETVELVWLDWRGGIELLEHRRDLT